MAVPTADSVFSFQHLGAPSWGPPARGNGGPQGSPQDGGQEKKEQESLLEVLPFDLNLKSSLFSQQLFRCCDFTFNSKQRDGRGPQVYDEEKEFHTVDSKPLMRQRYQGEGWMNRRRAPVKQTTAAFNEKTKEEEELRLGKKAKSDQKKQQQQQQARYARMHARHRAFSEWSIQPTNDWQVLAELPLQQLHKQHVDSAHISVEDVEWRGTLGVYSKQADKINTKLPVQMQNLSSNFDYYWVTTQDDEVISEYLLDESKHVDVAATDQVLACLMAAPQSRYSWHLYITKVENRILIDKANGSIVDLLTVNETSSDPPMQDAENRLNRPAALGFEAVKVNQNLRQQLLVPGEVAATHKPAPFVESGDTPATIAYRYRIFTIPPRTSGSTRGPIKILTRAEVYAKSSVARTDLKEKREGDKFIVDGGGYIYTCALNEIEPKGQKSWKHLLETQRGALLATEVRNNACKLRKFVTSAMIGGCDEFRLGFVTRRTPYDNEQHVILTVHNYQTRDLGRQIGLRPDNAWGIVRSVVDLLDDKPDGRYVLLKDPTKPVMRLYSRPEEEQDEGDEDNADGGSQDAA